MKVDAMHKSVHPAGAPAEMMFSMEARKRLGAAPQLEVVLTLM